MWHWIGQRIASQWYQLPGWARRLHCRLWPQGAFRVSWRVVSNDGKTVFAYELLDGQTRRAEAEMGAESLAWVKGVVRQGALSFLD